jgi:hypothetical protein
MAAKDRFQALSCGVSDKVAVPELLVLLQKVMAVVPFFVLRMDVILSHGIVSYSAYSSVNCPS